MNNYQHFGEASHSRETPTWHCFWVFTPESGDADGKTAIRPLLVESYSCHLNICWLLHTGEENMGILSSEAENRGV